MRIVWEQRCDEGVRFFKDGVCGTIRTIDGGGKESDWIWNQRASVSSAETNAERMLEAHGLYR